MTRFDARASVAVAPQIAPPIPMRTLSGIVIVSVGLRVLSAFLQGNVVSATPGMADQLSYDELAHRVLAGYGFSFAEGHWPATAAGTPTAHWSFLYTLYLAGVYAVVGAAPLVARVLQAMLTGWLQVWLAYRVGSRLFGVNAGLLGAVFTAVYAYFVYYGGGLLTEAFYLVGVLWVLDSALALATPARGRARQWQWALFGLAIGMTVSLRQVFLVSVPVVVIWVVLELRRHVQAERSQSRAELRGAALATVIVIAFIAPWTVRNYRAFGSVVPLNTNAGFAIYWGNHPIHGTSFIPLLPEGGPVYRDLIPAEDLSLNEGALDRRLLRRGIGLIAGDPIRFARLSLSRSVEYFRFWPSSESGLLSNAARVGSFGLLLPLMLVGLWQSWRGRGAPARGVAHEVTLLWAWVVVYAAIHLASWTLIRYRLPIDAVLVLFAALPASRLLSKVTHSPHVQYPAA